MNPSAPDLVRALAATIETELLPTLDASSWPASNLRSCLALLHFLEKRVEAEGPALFAENAELRQLLGEAAASQAADDALKADISDALARHRERAPYPSIGELAAENDAYRTLIERVVARSQADRRATGAARGELDDRIRAYLLAMAQRDFTMMAPALATPPF